jgi:hypothetical protein
MAGPFSWHRRIKHGVRMRLVMRHSFGDANQRPTNEESPGHEDSYSSHSVPSPAVSDELCAVAALPSSPPVCGSPGIHGDGYEEQPAPECN